MEDLRSHASYSGGFSETSPQVLWLWELLVSRYQRIDFIVSICVLACLGYLHLAPLPAAQGKRFK